MYSIYGSRDCSGGPRCTFHQSELPSFTVVDLVSTVFAVPGVCKMTTETGIRWFSAMLGSTVDTNLRACPRKSWENFPHFLRENMESDSAQTLNHVRKLRNNTFVGNTGHIDNEINFAVSEGLEGMKVELQAYRTMSTIAAKIITGLTRCYERTVSHITFKRLKVGRRVC